MATAERIPLRERRPSTGAPIVDIQGSVGPAGISRPKHKRTFTGFGATEIKSVEGACAAGIHWVHSCCFHIHSHVSLSGAHGAGLAGSISRGD